MMDVLATLTQVLGGAAVLVAGVLGWKKIVADGRAANAAAAAAPATYDTTLMGRTNESFDRLAIRLESELTRVSDEAKDLRERLEHVEQDRAADRHIIEKLRTSLRRLSGVMAREVSTVIEWAESGAKPPPPTREIDVIRSVVQDMDDLAS